MIIRKKFGFCGAHMVRDCSSKRCALSQHGHNYEVEVFITSDGLDRGGMVVDFGLLKTHVGTCIDSFDHAYSIWSEESNEVKDAIKKISSRWVEMPVSPSAEQYAIMFFYFIDTIIKHTQFANAEKNPRLHAVRVHETATGYAEACRGDLAYAKYKLADIIFSQAIKDEWVNATWFDEITHSKPVGVPSCFKNITPEFQIFISPADLKDPEFLKEFVDKSVFTEIPEPTKPEGVDYLLNNPLFDLDYEN